jgi:hypothetical protein
MARPLQACQDNSHRGCKARGNNSANVQDYWKRIEEKRIGKKIEHTAEVSAIIETAPEPASKSAPKPAPETAPEPIPDPAPEPKTYARAAAFTGRAYRKPTSRPYQKA